MVDKHKLEAIKFMQHHKSIASKKYTERISIGERERERERCYGMTSLVRPDLKWDPYSTHSWVQYFKNTILCLDFTSHPLDNINAISIFGLNWSLPSQKLQKHHPKAVDVAFLIDFQCVCIFCKYPKSDLVLRKKKRRKKKRHIEYSIYITFAFEVLLNCKPFVCSALNPKPY